MIDKLSLLPLKIKKWIFISFSKTIDKMEHYDLEGGSILIKSITRCTFCVTLGPLIVHMFGAISCLLFSTTYHLFDAYSERANSFLSRLDYGGISLLIAGSSYPPIIYGFYCNSFVKIAYLIIITSTCLAAFVMTLMPEADTPAYRRMRGFLFIFVGLFAGVPAVHGSLSYDPNVILNRFYWATGGAIYIIGALIYVARIPERLAPGRFDFCVYIY